MAVLTMVASMAKRKITSITPVTARERFLAVCWCGSRVFALFEVGMKIDMQRRGGKMLSYSIV
jgi:hypothetical protein